MCVVMVMTQQLVYQFVRQTGLKWTVLTSSSDTTVREPCMYTSVEILTVYFALKLLNKRSFMRKNSCGFGPKMRHSKRTSV